MLKERNGIKKIDTNADPTARGIYLQVLRAVDRLLQALLDKRRAILCTIEYIDDVLEIEWGSELTSYVTEQDKSYTSAFSLNSEEIKQSLLIFFDNWYTNMQESEKITFVFYTNTRIAKERRVGILKEMDNPLPDEPLIQLLIDGEYDRALPFVIGIFKEYYLNEHKKHTDDISPYEELMSSLTNEKWKSFFCLIEWNFNQKTENELRKSLEEKVKRLCLIYSVDSKYITSIVAEVIDKVESGILLTDFLERAVHVSEIENLFKDYAKEVKIRDSLDPSHMKWDEISLEDIRSLENKILAVSPEYDAENIVDLNEEWADGKFDQNHFSDKKQVSSYKYRIYKRCKKIVKRAIRNHNGPFTEEEIDNIIDTSTTDAYCHIEDISKTYDIPFLDKDMVRKTILLLFEECYLAFDEGGNSDE